MRQGLSGLVAVLVMAACASAQTRTDVHPGKVEILSSASDALVVIGGVQAAGLATGATTATTGLRIASGAIAAEGAAVAAPAGFTVHGATSSPDWAQVIFGDGTGYRLNFGTRTGGNFASRFQIYDTGSTRFASGSAGAPSVAFISGSTTGLYLSGSDLGVAVSGVATARFISGSSPTMFMEPAASGTGAVRGAALMLGQNTSGGRAPGCLALGTTAGSSTTAAVWVDSTGLARTTTGSAIAVCPTESGGDTGGTIIGTQSSQRAAKDILWHVPQSAGAAALGILRETPVFAFRYKDGRYNGETFYGITTDDSPLFGMDGGKAFNPVTAFGVTVLAMQELERRVRALEARQ